MGRTRGAKSVYLGAIAALVLLTSCGGEGVDPRAPALEAPHLQATSSSEWALATTHTFKPLVEPGGVHRERGEVAEVKHQGSGRIAFAGNFGGPFTFAGQRYFGGDPNDQYREPPNTNGFVGTLTDEGAHLAFRAGWDYPDTSGPQRSALSAAVAMSAGKEVFR